MPAPDALSHEWLKNLELRLLAVQRVEARRWWNFAHVVSPFSRLWLILDGRATVTHHGRQFELVPGKVHLVPPFARHDCCCQRRMERAQYLLLTTPSPVKEVAANVGIEDAAYFSRVFTFHCGRSPSDYRTTHSH